LRAFAVLDVCPFTMACHGALVEFALIRRRVAFSAGLRNGQAPSLQRAFPPPRPGFLRRPRRCLQIFPRQIDTYVNVNLASFIRGR
ncbi:MAG: hypothetical protein R3265_04945, partial [Hyphomonas sp.]|nr:hypothetical protein [Hyphomonas sp.]